MNSRQAKKQAAKSVATETTKKTVATPVVEEKVEEVIVEKAETKAPAKKAAEKKVAEKVEKVEKAEKKTVEKKEVVPEIFIQYGSYEAELEHVVDSAKQAYADLGHRVSSIKDLKIYLKPEDSAAYYVVNGKVAGKVDLF